jgi:4-aminobutyrate aminotransferase-like enzyme
MPSPIRQELGGDPNVDPTPRIASHWVRQARDAGLLLHLSGIHRNRIVLIPPLIAYENHFQVAFEILAKIASLDIPFDIA